jgi:hypothetical protein
LHPDPVGPAGFCSRRNLRHRRDQRLRVPVLRRAQHFVRRAGR